MTAGAPEGWYPNPDGSPSNRYWDGTTWTDHIGPPNTPPSGDGLGNAIAPPAHAGCCHDVAMTRSSRVRSGSRPTSLPPTKAELDRSEKARELKNQPP